MTNLLTNAIRYNHDDGRVLVTTRSSKSEVFLCISDTGIGIEPEHLPHIFERFYRVDKARSRKDGGIGLGLAICKSIVEAHGGQIAVTSDTDGGSQFEVRLPKRGARGCSKRPGDSEESRMEVVATGAKGLIEVHNGVGPLGHARDPWYDGFQASPTRAGACDN